MPERPICFVIAPIGKEASEPRIRSDRILKHIIAPIADECGYEAIRADKISEAGMITTQVINHILNDPMVVADLTGSNANVFYELAVRHAVRRPYVQMIQKGEPIPFDVAGMRTIEVDHTDLDSVASTKEEMKKQMVSTAEAGARLESPISVAINFDKLHRSDDPAKRQLADILSAITELKTSVEQRMSIMEHLEANLFRSAPRIQLGGGGSLDLTGLQEAVKEISALLLDLKSKNMQLLREKVELEKEKAELENRIKQP